MDSANLSFLGVLLLSYLVGFASLPQKALPLGVYLGLFLLVAGAERIRSRGGGSLWARLLLFAYPVAFLFGSFESLHFTLPYANLLRFDAAFARADLSLLGVNPTVWMERFAHPWLTDLLAAAYLFYFPMPLILLAGMMARRRYAQVGDAFFRYLVCYYGAYIGYFLFPARGPRFFLAAEHQGPVAGAFLTDPIFRLIDALEPNKLDAFPSLHAAILVVTLLLAFRNDRALFRWFVPIGAAILISLVYLRYHYVVDVVAGVAWALAADRLAGALTARFGPRLALHFGEAR